MSFNREVVYKFRAQGNYITEQRVDFCAEFVTVNRGEAAVKFYAEIYEPTNRDRFETVSGETVYTTWLVKDPTSGDYRTDDDDVSWLLRSIIRSLAQNKSADPNLVWDVFWHTQVKESRPWVREAAPLWWEMVGKIFR